VQIAGLLEIGDLAQILKDIMALKEEPSSIAGTITKDERRSTLSHKVPKFTAGKALKGAVK
jgi:nucleoid DNA-binding protein